MQVRAKSALLGCCVVLASAASLAAQQRRGPSTWSERPPSLQTLHSRTFTQRTAALQAPIEHVILLSVDGMMPDTYVHPDAHGLKVPTLRAMVRQGSSSEGVLGVFPTLTYPSHTSMVTGVNPGTHGIITNAQGDPLDNLHGAWRWYAEDIRVPTLWDAARAKGLTTALVFWPVTVGAKGNAVVPEFWRQVPGTVEDTKLNFALSTPGLLDTVAKRFPNFRPRFLPPRAGDEALTDIAIHVIEALKPNLLLLHITDVDHSEHDDGPFTGRVLPALETADEQIARVIGAAKKAGIWNQTALVVVSDHGFARTAHRVRPGVWLREKGFVKVEDRTIVGWKAYCLANGGSAYIYVKDPDDQETRKTLLEMFEKAATGRDSGIGRVLTHDEIVRAGGDPAAFLALEAEEGWAIAGGVVGEAISPASNAGEHGYLPDRPEMRSSLLVYGPAIGSSKIESARMIDIAPTIARWLGLKLEKAEGTPLKIPLRRAVASP
ncbi:MAG TPA: ectonucleotide pyrophosphatase/phosphodiesterase [Candidatus Acidoferrales bacterium]|nr:ectonucleotide pyrophosphatase/phosphodiesterase [Candidatus Acidoferrales bacterium]